MSVVVRDPELFPYPAMILSDLCKMAEIIIVSTPVSSVVHDILEEIFTLHMLDLVFDALSFMLPVLSLLHHLVEAGFRKHMRSYAEWYHQTE